MRKQAALIIIDMQKGMQHTDPELRNNHCAEETIQGLLNAWRDASGPIVHIRHMSRTVGSPFWPGQVGAEFQDALQPLATEAVFEKNVPDAFIQSGLERWLRVRDIERVVFAGVSTNNSVESSARTAGNLGFETYVVHDGTYAYAKRDFHGVYRAAEEVHAMALANLDGEYATIIGAKDALDRFARQTESGSFLKP